MSSAASTFLAHRPRILLTNDDGISAPGLVTLERIARLLSDDIWVVAPDSEQSGSSHSLSLHSPLRVIKHDVRRYSVLGTPTDCVGFAVKHLLKGQPVDLVLSGVNRGSNIAEDITYSGTVAAAMEGTALGVPSIALSQAYGFQGDEKVRFETAELHGPAIIASLVRAGWPQGVLININFPDREPDAVERIEATRQGRRDQSNLLVEERRDLRNHPYYWLGMSRKLSDPPEGTDLRAIYAGRISVTPLHLNLTELGALPEIETLVGGVKLEGPRGI